MNAEGGRRLRERRQRRGARIGRSGGGRIGAITLRTMRIQLDEAAAIARTAEGCAVDGQAGRALMMALDVEPLAIEANQLLQGLAILSRIARDETDEAALPLAAGSILPTTE